MLCSPTDVREKRHMVNVHLVECDQTSVSVLLCYSELCQNRLLCITREVSPYIGLQINVSWQFDGQSGLTDKSIVIIRNGRYDAQSVWVVFCACLKNAR